ncbi:class I SAM-dependent methyltransferase [Taklimakanibacter deserti]|uniref:class I SAM-dependent methyltransferase n=1 Tax=Taklimakanibacter deserti TaxID=2267839 RepID=UPI003F6881AE
MKLVDHPDFIRQNTTILAPPLVPEVLLHLAHEAVPIWQKTEEELGEIGLPPPFWAFAWAGGQALSRYVLDHPHLVNAKSVLDLATGSGLVAIAAKKAGARSVLAADIDRFACAAARLNAQANGVAIDIGDEDLLQDAPHDFDVVLVGDLFYEKALAERVHTWLIAAKAGGADILIGDPGRSYLPKSALLHVVDYNVPVTRELEDSEIKRTSVWRI